MANLDINVSGKILTNNDIVSVDIQLEKLLREDSTYGIGVLPIPVDGITFFNAFDLIGIGRGYFSNPLQIAYGPQIYGYGKELTETIREDVDLITATISVSPAGSYRVLVNVRGPGQIFMYVDPSTYAYGPVFVEGGFNTYDGVTDSNGNLELKVSVPFSDNKYYTIEKNEFGDDFISSSSNKSAGMTELLVTVLDKIPNTDQIGIIGHTSTIINTLQIPIIGYIE